MAKKKQYSPEEKKAYHMGRAYAVAKAGGRVNCPDEKTKASFRNGVKAVKGRRKKAKSKNTGKQSAGGCLVVDSDGVVIGTADFRA